MVRALGEEARVPFAVQLFDRFTDAPVQPDAAQRREAVGQRLPHQLVREPEVPEPVVRFVDDAGHPRGLDEVERAVLVDAAHVRDERDVELAARDRARGEHRDRFLGQAAPESGAQHVAHAFGHWRVRRCVAEPAFVLQESHELADEERVARGPVVERVGEVRVGVVTHDRRHVVADLVDG